MGRLKNNYSGEQLDPLVGSIISASEKVNYAKGITNDWQDYVFRTVFTMDHQLSFQGGNEKTTYMASVSYLDNPGVVLQFELPAHERLCQHQPENERLAVRRSHHAVREP